MSRKCAVTGKKPLAGNNVSHANNKTRRQFLPNLQNVSLLSQSLGMSFNFRLTTRGIRTVEKHGGLDGYVLNSPNRKLAAEFIKIKKKVSEKTKASA